MNVIQFENKLLSYISEEMLPKMPNNLNKFLGYMTVGALTTKMDNILQPYMNMAKKINVIDEQGQIDLDALDKALCYAFDNIPTINLWNFTFTKSDVPHFISYMKV